MTRLENLSKRIWWTNTEVKNRDRRVFHSTIPLFFLLILQPYTYQLVYQYLDAKYHQNQPNNITPYRQT